MSPVVAGFNAQSGFRGLPKRSGVVRTSEGPTAAGIHEMVDEAAKFQLINSPLRFTYSPSACKVSGRKAVFPIEATEPRAPIVAKTHRQTRSFFANH